MSSPLPAVPETLKAAVEWYGKYAQVFKGREMPPGYLDDTLGIIAKELASALDQARRETLEEASLLQEEQNASHGFNGASLLLAEMQIAAGEAKPLSEAMRDIRLACDKKKSLDWVDGYNAGRAGASNTTGNPSLLPAPEAREEPSNG